MDDVSSARFRSRTSDTLRWRRIGVPAAGLVLILLVGGSVQAPALVLTAELGALSVLGWWLATVPARAWQEGLPVLLASLALIALGALQLWPLGFATWAALPGRATAVAIAQASGTTGSHPLSLDPDATIADLLLLVIPLAMALAGLSANRAEAQLLKRGIIGVALGSAALGTLQVASGNHLHLFPESHAAGSIGIFANRNHHADLLMIALLLLAEETRAATPLARPFLVPTMALLAASVIMTGSRLGMILLPFALLGALAILSTRRSSLPRLPLLTALGAAAGVALLLLFNPAASGNVARFRAIGHDPRPLIWANTAVAVRDYWPYGAGIGSFVPVYGTVERLDSVDQHYVVHAHNDYLETMLETGAAGAALLAAYAAALLAASVRGLRRSCRVAAPISGVLILLLHSIGDYPLRTPALLAVFGLLNGLIFSRVSNTPDPEHVSQ